MEGIAGKEQALILVKAVPQAGDSHGETVCCAGVTVNRHWRRQYPIRFRSLRQNKFKRWQWIEYSWRLPRNDNRVESRRVIEGSIVLKETMKNRERPGFLEPIIFNSLSSVDPKIQSLTLVRPSAVCFSYKEKDEGRIKNEKEAYISAARQPDLFNNPDKELQALSPCPYEFRLEHTGEDGKSHDHCCLDWETTAMFYNWRKSYGDANTLKKMKEIFEREYFIKGMALAFGTHSRRPNQWLLLGIIRVDFSVQSSFDLA